MPAGGALGLPVDARGKIWALLPESARDLADGTSGGTVLIRFF
jgi:hypothetical protein